MSDAALSMLKYNKFCVKMLTLNTPSSSRDDGTEQHQDDIFTEEGEGLSKMIKTCPVLPKRPLGELEQTSLRENSRKEDMEGKNDKIFKQSRNISHFSLRSDLIHSAYYKLNSCVAQVGDITKISCYTLLECHKKINIDNIYSIDSFSDFTNKLDGFLLSMESNLKLVRTGLNEYMSEWYKLVKSHLNINEGEENGTGETIKEKYHKKNQRNENVPEEQYDENFNIDGETLHKMMKPRCAMRRKFSQDVEGEHLIKKRRKALTKGHQRGTYVKRETKIIKEIKSFRVVLKKISEEDIWRTVQEYDEENCPEEHRTGALVEGDTTSFKSIRPFQVALHDENDIWRKIQEDDKENCLEKNQRGAIVEADTTLLKSIRPFQVAIRKLGENDIWRIIHEYDKENCTEKHERGAFVEVDTTLLKSIRPFQVALRKLCEKDIWRKIQEYDEQDFPEECQSGAFVKADTTLLKSMRPLRVVLRKLSEENIWRKIQEFNEEDFTGECRRGAFLEADTTLHKSIIPFRVVLTKLGKDDIWGKIQEYDKEDFTGEPQRSAFVEANTTLLKSIIPFRVVLTKLSEEEIWRKIQEYDKEDFTGEPQRNAFLEADTTLLNSMRPLQVVLRKLSEEDIWRKIKEYEEEDFPEGCPRGNIYQ